MLTLEQDLKRSAEIKTLVATFSNLARVKFGALPPARAAQVAKASSQQLGRWLEALVLVDSLDAVFGYAGPD